MKALGRNMRYWLGTLEKQGLLILAYVLVLAAVVAFLGGSGFVEEFQQLAPTYIVMVLMIFPFSNAVSGVLTFFNMTVAFGSGRKSSFAAMQIAQHMVMLELMAIYLTSLFLQTPEEIKAYGGIAVTTGMAAVCVIQGFSSLVGAAGVRFSRNIAVAVYVILVVLCVGIVGLLLVLGEIDVMTVAASFVNLLQGPWLLAAGAVFDAAMILVYYNVMRSRDLQFS